MNTAIIDDSFLKSKPMFSKSEDSAILGFASEIYGYGQSLLKDLDFKSTNKKNEKTTKEIREEKKW